MKLKRERIVCHRCAGYDHEQARINRDGLCHEHAFDLYADYEKVDRQLSELRASVKGLIAVLDAHGVAL